MGVQVVFDPNAFKIAFPTFVNLTNQTLTNVILPIAEIYCRNDGGGPVSSAATQTSLLNLMVAHVAQLLYGPDGMTPTALVGRISSASQGSVSVSTEFPVTQTTAWFMQTQFGAAFYQATAAYRTMRYMPKTSPLPRAGRVPLW